MKTRKYSHPTLKEKSLHSTPCRADLLSIPFISLLIASQTNTPNVPIRTEVRVTDNPISLLACQRGHGPCVDVPACAFCATASAITADVKRRAIRSVCAAQRNSCALLSLSLFLQPCCCAAEMARKCCRSRFPGSHFLPCVSSYVFFASITSTAGRRIARTVPKLGTNSSNTAFQSQFVALGPFFMLYLNIILQIETRRLFKAVSVLGFYFVVAVERRRCASFRPAENLFISHA